MGLFDNFTEKMSSVGNQISSKAKDTGEQFRLENEIRNLQKDEQAKYCELGKLLYGNKRMGAHNSEESFDRICSVIDLIRQQEGERQQKIVALKSQITCPACGKSVPKEAAYCPYCSVSLHVKPENEWSFDSDKANKTQPASKTGEESKKPDTKETAAQEETNEESIWSTSYADAGSEENVAESPQKMQGYQSGKDRCVFCGMALKDEEKICSFCGAPRGAAPVGGEEIKEEKKELVNDTENKQEDDEESILMSFEEVDLGVQQPIFTAAGDAPKMSAKFCFFCGTALEEDAEVCPKCGTKQDN